MMFILCIMLDSKKRELTSMIMAALDLADSIKPREGRLWLEAIKMAMLSMRDLRSSVL